MNRPLFCCHPSPGDAALNRGCCCCTHMLASVWLQCLQAHVRARARTQITIYRQFEIANRECKHSQSYSNSFVSCFRLDGRQDFSPPLVCSPAVPVAAGNATKPAPLNAARHLNGRGPCSVAQTGVLAGVEGGAAPSLQSCGASRRARCGPSASCARPGWSQRRCFLRWEILHWWLAERHCSPRR